MQRDRPVIKETPIDRQIKSNMNDSNTMPNMFDRQQRHMVWQHNLPEGFGNSRVDSGYLYNPNFAESQTRTGGSASIWWNPKTWGQTNGTLDNEANLYRHQKEYLAALQSLNKDGFTLEGNGASYSVSPETVAFLNATSPFYTTQLTRDPATKEAITNQITGNVQQLYDQQGTWKALGGFREYNTKIQKDLNAMYQHAMYELKSNDPKVREHGQYMMGVVARGQQVFNMAQPKISEGVQNRIKPYRDFMKNNWWWMIPGGLLALGGIASLFGGRDSEQQTPEQAGWPFAQNAPQQPRQPLPEGWTSPLVPRQSIVNTGLV